MTLTALAFFTVAMTLHFVVTDYGLNEEHKAPYALVGFGGGPRICIGINFAQVEIKALISHLLRNYQLELVPDQQIVQMYMPTSMPINGIRMRVAPRAA